MKVKFDIKYRQQIESGEYKVETADGRQVRIVCWDAHNPYRENDIVALATSSSGEAENILRYYSNGHLISDSANVGNKDLIVVIPDEDERIKKIITDSVFYQYGAGAEYKDVLDYLDKLEKQKEQKPTDLLDTMLSKDPHLPKQAFKHEQKPVEIDEYKIIKKHITEDSLSSEVNKRLKECGWYVTDEKPAECSYDNKIQYDSVKSGIEAFASTYSFNIESKLFPQLTKEQQRLWIEEIEQAVIAGGESGVELARDNRYKENRITEWSEDDKKMLLSIINAFRNGTVSTIGQEQWLKSLPERFNLQPMQKDNKCISPKEGDIVVNKYGEISVFENWGHHPDGGSFNDDSYFFAKCTLAGDYYDDFDCHPESEGLRYATPEEIRKIVPYLLKEKI